VAADLPEQFATLELAGGARSSTSESSEFDLTDEPGDEW
jgi:hypothetical protein